MRTVFYLPFFALFTLLLAAGCGASGGTKSNSEPCTPAVRARPQSKIFEGFFEGPNNAETRRAAMARTLGEALQPLGVQVSSEFESVQIAADGVDSSRITLQDKVSMKPIEVRDLKVGTCYDGTISAVRAAVAITDVEWKRLTRVFRGGTLLVLDCKTEPKGACDEELFDSLSEAAGDAGLNITSAIEPPKGVRKGSARALIALGEKEEAAQILWVSLKGKFKGEIDEVLYAYTTASASLIETSDGQVRHSVTKKDIKGAHYAKLEKIRYGPDTALGISLKKAVSELHDAMRGWKD